MLAVHKQTQHKTNWKSIIEKSPVPFTDAMEFKRRETTAERQPTTVRQTQHSINIQ